MLGMIQILLKLSRKNKQALIFLFDIFAIIGSTFIAYYMHLGYFYYPAGDSALMFVIFISPILGLPIFVYFGLYLEMIRYMSFESLWRIAQAVSLYSILWTLVAFMIAINGIPGPVIFINWLLLILVLSSSRLLARWFLLEVNVHNNVLIFGAGEAGRQLSNALAESKDYKLVAFIDDDSNIYHHLINGLVVYSRNDLKELIKSKNITEVLLSIPSLSRFCRNEIINYLEDYPVIVRSLPSVSDLAQGKVKINDLLEIDLLDLLGRDSVSPNKNLIKKNIENKIVLVTGAGGSIGSELCRQILFLKPKKLILYDISEPSLYLIHQELMNDAIAGIEVVPVIGSVVERQRVKVIFKYYGVQTIYHAAAYKHVPLVEYNPSQGILNNALGTKIVAEEAISENVETFVLISTDKAVRPTSVMGASKRIAELILQALAQQQHNTCLNMVRFGNVLDSSGSVIPLFKKQIKTGGPITVTHSDIVRYFMTIPEAVELVIQAGSLGDGGEVFLLDMGEPIRIYDLAVKMIQLSGLQVLDENHPNGDIEIQYTGLRPGEKLYEELLIDGDFDSTEHKLIMRAKEKMISWDKLDPILVQLNEAAVNSDTQKIYKIISQIVPESLLTIKDFDSIESSGLNKK